MSTVADYPEFEDLLEKAELGARSQWDETFVQDLADKHVEYGDRMFLSDSQYQQLERIANQ